MPVLSIVLTIALQLAGGQEASGQGALPPVVVRTEPMSGRADVDAARTKEIRVTFSKDMDPKGFSFTVRDLGMTKGIRVFEMSYEAGTRTFSIPCELKPDTTYEIWVNVSAFECEDLMPEASGENEVHIEMTYSAARFQDRQKRAAVPYLIAFDTKGAE
jgi:hypothetical protein